MENFSIEYHNELIRVRSIGMDLTEKYQLEYEDERWLTIGKRPDDTRTVATFNANISYSTATVWVIEGKSEGPDWINMEQLQVVGEIITRKAHELENAA